MSTLDFLSTSSQLGNEAAPYKPTGFGEVVQSALYSFGQRTGLEITPVLETAQDYSEREDLLKQRFSPDELTAMTGTDQELRNQTLKADVAKGAPLSSNYLPEIAAIKNQKLDSAIVSGREQDPVKWQGIKTIEELKEEKRNRARAATENYQDLASKAAPSTALIGSLVGGLGAAFTDPINIATLPFGATSGMGILKAMKVEALLNAGVEAAEVPLVASWQKELGYKYGVGDAALDVTTAGVGGAALAGVIRGARPALEIVGKAFDSSGKYFGSKSQPILQKMAASENLPSSVKDAASYMSRVSHIDENNPLTIRVTPEGLETKLEAQDIALNRQTLQDTQDAFKDYTQPVYTEKFKDLDYKQRKAFAYEKALTLEKTNLAQDFVKKSKSPETVYHGSMSNFEKFDKEFLGSNTGASSAKQGFFFTNNIEIADDFLQFAENKSKAGKGVIKPFKLNLENPLVINHSDIARSQGDYDNYILEAKLKGNDGVIIRDTIDTPFANLSDVHTESSKRSDVYIVFDENKILDLTQKNNAKYQEIEQSISRSPEEDLIVRPNDALASMERDIETIESINNTQGFKADFERLLKEKPDLEIETEGGKFTLKEIKEQLDSDENILSAIKTCAIGGISK